jgi:hypothetical protein
MILDDWRPQHVSPRHAVMDECQLVFGYVATLDVLEYFGTVRNVRVEVTRACHAFANVLHVTTVDFSSGFYCLLLTLCDPGDIFVCFVWCVCFILEISVKTHAV